MELVRNNTAHYKSIRDEFIEAQNGLCAICLKILPSKRNLDHCHATGMIRGVLCNSCNVMLGWYETRRKAIEGYLANAAEFAAYELAKPKERMPRGSTLEQEQWRMSQRLSASSA
jgi:hypothetical protein